MLASAEDLERAEVGAPLATRGDDELEANEAQCEYEPHLFAPYTRAWNTGMGGAVENREK
jgi:hypothetical protein